MQLHTIDGIVLFGTLAFIVLYGLYKTKHVNSSEQYLRGAYDMPWWLIGLSVMATQASAITFLSTPGQGFDEGMSFVQAYFGLPLAIVIICVFFLPIYYRLKVYTAYEYLEHRFDLKTRTLTAFLFLIQRGLAAGMTIYAPAIILSSILEWRLYITNLIIGILVIIYTASGGTKAVSQTQKQQMIVIFAGMFFAFAFLINGLPEGFNFNKSLHLAGSVDKLNVLDFNFDLSNRYNIWSGILGGTFLSLSYFGTDQSQVQRYLSGRSLAQSRLGLLFNAIVKIPMQFFILLTGVLVFVFFIFHDHPLHFNSANVNEVLESKFGNEYRELSIEHQLLLESKHETARTLGALEPGSPAWNETSEELNRIIDDESEMRENARYLIEAHNSELDSDDSDYVFLNFIMGYLPVGLVGLLLAVIFSAAMSSTSSELSALATTTSVDIYKRSVNKNADDRHYLQTSKLFTVLWGILALIFAMTASLFDNLIEAVNIIGSIFYGTILGIFVVAFFIKFIKSTAVFIAALITEGIVIALYMLDRNETIELEYLWLNFIGCILVVLIGSLLELLLPGKNER